ncbi:unnamed protein product, partial [Amoebophrya sp. A25]
ESSTGKAASDSGGCSCTSNSNRVIKNTSSPSSARGTFSTVSVLQQLAGISGAIENKLEPGVRDALRNEIKGIQDRASLRQKTKPVSAVSTDAQLKARANDNLFLNQEKVKEGRGSDSENDEPIEVYIARMESMNMMASMAVGALVKNKKFVKAAPWFDELARRKCPEIHLEFSKERGWPVGIDKTFARKVLYRGHLNAQCHPHTTAMMMADGRYTLQDYEVIKRWHGTGALNVLEQQKKLYPGLVLDARAEINSTSGERRQGHYDLRIRANFANSPTPKDCLFFGTTHVAIGFNDLGSLLNAPIMDEPEDYIPKNGSAKGGPLHWVGYERSE